MAFIPAQDEWAVGSSSASGSAVTPGNLVLTRAIHRGGSNNRAATISDNGVGNTWHPVGPLKRPTTDPVNGPLAYRGVVAGGSGDTYLWYCVPVSPFTRVDVAVEGDPYRILFVREWAGNALTDVLVASNVLANPSMRGPLPVVEVDTAGVDGCLITGSLGATVSNRNFPLLTPDYVAGREHRANQSTLISATRVDAPAGTHGPQWELDGTASTVGLITAAFRPAGSTPDPDPEPAEGSASGTFTWTGHTTGVTTRRGGATGTHEWTGTTEGRTTHQGTTIASHSWAGTTEGRTAHRGNAAGTHTWTGHTTGAAPDVDTHTGTVTGTHQWTGHTEGARPSVGTTHGTHTWAGTTAGARPSRGSTTGAVSWTGRTVGAHPGAPGRNITITVVGVVGAELEVRPPVHPLAVTGPARVTGHVLTAPTGSPVALAGPVSAPVVVTDPEPGALATTVPVSGLLAVTAPRS